MSTATIPTWTEMCQKTETYFGPALKKLGLDPVFKKNGDFCPKKVLFWSRQQGGTKEPYISLYKEEGEKSLYAVELFDKESCQPLNPRKLFTFKGGKFFTEEHEEIKYEGKTISYRVWLSDLVEVPMAQDRAPWEDPAPAIVEDTEVRYGIKLEKLTHKDLLALIHLVEVADHDVINADIRAIKTNKLISKAA